jgi:hypothetical protein
MPVDDVGDLEAGKADFADALELVTEVVAPLAQLIVDVRKDAVALALADVERLAVARVNEPVNVGLELGHHVRREHFGLRHRPQTVSVVTDGRVRVSSADRGAPG